MSDKRKSSTSKNLSTQVFERLKKYENLSLLEQYAMFMGRAQILEMGLKNVLEREFGITVKISEKWTLGRTSRELKKVGARIDFVKLLNSFVELRNYIAHEFLANEALLRSILGGKSGRLEIRQFEIGIYELEQLILIFDLQEKHNIWK